MFNIGGGELIVIMLIALIVLGPSRLPDAARQVGKVMGDLRRLSSGFQNEMKTAFDAADDQSHVSSRRNVLANEPRDDTDQDRPEDADVAADDPEAEARSSSDEVAATTPVADAIAAVSSQPSAPAQPAANGTPVEPAPVKKAVVEKAATKKATTKSATPAKEKKKQKKTSTAVSKAAPLRTKP